MNLHTLSLFTKFDTMTPIEMTDDEFMSDLPGRFEDIRRGDVFRVRVLQDIPRKGLLPAGLNDEQRQIVFVIGPADICDALGLAGDPEYGWPAYRRLEEITSINDLMPGYRCHPFFMDTADSPRPFAASVTVLEWNALQDELEP